MNTSRESISIAALEAASAEVDPAALLVPPRILRRVIKQHAHLTAIGLRVPHRKTYILHREALLAIVDLDELDLPRARELAETLILIARPSAERIIQLSKEESSTLIWRMLFHARIHRAMDQRISEGRLTELDVRQRIGEIGRTEFEEIRAVLRAEDMLLPPRDAVSVYVEFAAVYWELRYFASGFLHSYFPSVEDFDRIDGILRRDVPAEDVFVETRLPEAPEDPDRGELLLTEAPAPEKPERPPRRFSERVYRRLARAAERVAPLGNSVRSAVLRYQAASAATGEAGRDARFAALADVGNLARRLQAAIGFSESEAADWEQSLSVLVGVSSAGTWPPGMRLLYDLQKVCIDHERGVFSLDLIGWFKSGCKGPIKRPLPGQREVLIAKHLRSAANRLPAVPLAGKARIRLGSLLHSAEHRAENNLRAYFKPLIVEAFDAVGLLAKNLPEQIARQKLIDELLDLIAERGFLTMGDLRDGISRNNLKLPDVTQFNELRYGDQVLQSDRQLAPRLDGVYRRGEVYLRWPQQLSSLAFGTPPGRFLTQFVVIPFGGAYVVLEFIQHLANAIRGHEARHSRPIEASPIDSATLPPTSENAPVHLTAFPLVLLLGLFLLGLLHHPGFRRLCQEMLSVFLHGFKRLFYDWPKKLLEQPWVQSIVRSWPFQVFVQYVFKPAVLTSLLLTLYAAGKRSLPHAQSVAAVFVVVNLVLNSKLGRTVDELVTDWTVNTWHRFRIHVVATFLRLVMDLFHGILEAIERVLYAVDEWLRFRTGESRVVTGIKAVLTVIWSVVNYIIRFFVNLLVEPQINPIKHFPVVTVSHKIILPTLPYLIGLLAPFVGKSATPLATAIVFLTPGIFGFLVWELKENWRLYAANRPKNLLPVSLGHHGETILQFMRPGFRSGTLPKLYARLRRANRRAYWTDNWRASGRQLQGLRQVEESVRRFTDRELAALLEASRGWDGAQIAAGEIQLGVNRIAVELYSPDRGEESLWLAFEEHAGWLVANVTRRGWLDGLTGDARRTFENALAGFYKMSGVNLVREEIESQLDAADSDYEITEEGLVAWRGPGIEPHLLCRLDNGQGEALWDPLQTPQASAGHMDAHRLLFSNYPISWNRWISIWQRDQNPDRMNDGVLENAVLLPRG